MNQNIVRRQIVLEIYIFAQILCFVSSAMQ
jgi:hypothetical protein